MRKVHFKRNGRHCISYIAENDKENEFLARVFDGEALEAFFQTCEGQIIREEDVSVDKLILLALAQVNSALQDLAGAADTEYYYGDATMPDLTQTLARLSKMVED